MTTALTNAAAGIILASVFLAGCAPKSSYTPEERSAAAAELLADKTPEPAPYTPPVCYSAPQCDAMWSEALIQLQNISGTRIQTATESFAQTYNSVGSARLTGWTRKTPRPDGSTVIESQFDCGSYCGRLAYDARNLFASSVRGAGEGFQSSNQPVAPAAKPKP